ncbi:MAG: transposase [Rudaea sp.]
MARLPRPDIAGVAQHIVQRGNDRMPCFLDDVDRRLYLTALREMSMRYACAIHAYVLMSNHVHLLTTPETAGAVSQMMQGIGRIYVAEFNARHRRTGTLWEGRYKSCLVGGQRYVLTCHRYIELNPVRAAMVAQPSEFPWSSHLSNALGREDPILRSHPAYQALGRDAAERQLAYRALFHEVLTDTEISDIRAYIQQQRALGNDRFRAMVERKLGRCASVRPPHRPPAPPTSKSADKVL